MSTSIIPSEQPQQFIYSGKHPLRVIDHNGELWFIASDVCKVLDISNPSQAVSRLDDDEKGYMSDIYPSITTNALIVSEPGLYVLILRSDKPESRDFRRWITHDVIPAIRKSGLYATAFMTPAELAAYMGNLLVEQERKLVEHDQRLDQLEAITQSSAEYFTVVGYYNLKKLGSLSKYEARMVGIQAAKLSRDLGIEIKDVPNSEYGTVHTYHITVLQSVTKGSQK